MLRDECCSMQVGVPHTLLYCIPARTLLRLLVMHGCPPSSPSIKRYRSPCSFFFLLSLKVCSWELQCVGHHARDTRWYKRRGNLGKAFYSGQLHEPWRKRNEGSTIESWHFSKSLISFSDSIITFSSHCEAMLCINRGFIQRRWKYVA